MAPLQLTLQFEFKTAAWQSDAHWDGGGEGEGEGEGEDEGEGEGEGHGEIRQSAGEVALLDLLVAAIARPPS